MNLVEFDRCVFLLVGYHLLRTVPSAQLTILTGYFFEVIFFHFSYTLQHEKNDMIFHFCF